MAHQEAAQSITLIVTELLQLAQDINHLATIGSYRTVCDRAERAVELAERIADIAWDEHSSKCDTAGVSPFDAGITPRLNLAQLVRSQLGVSP